MGSPRAYHARTEPAGAAAGMAVSRDHESFYVLRGGVAWRLLPNDLPPRTRSWWIPMGVGRSSNRNAPTFRTGMARRSCCACRGARPFIAKAFADMGFAGD